MSSSAVSAVVSHPCAVVCRLYVASHPSVIMTRLPVPLRSPHHTRSMIPHLPPSMLYCLSCLLPPLASPCCLRLALCCPYALLSFLHAKNDFFRGNTHVRCAPGARSHVNRTANASPSLLGAAALEFSSLSSRVAHWRGAASGRCTLARSYVWRRRGSRSRRRIPSPTVRTRCMVSDGMPAW